MTSAFLTVALQVVAVPRESPNPRQDSASDMDSNDTVEKLLF